MDEWEQPIMDNQLPDIDELIKMASSEPEKLEALRKEMATQLIENAPEHFRKRLNGIQFQIDMERRKTNNPLHCCIKISEMMLDSYQNLQTAIHTLDETRNQSSDDFSTSNNMTQQSAEIIDIKIAQKA